MIQVYLVKQKLRTKQANGRRGWRWVLRWQQDGTFRQESTRTVDTLQAEAFRKRKFEELNGLREPPPVVVVEQETAKSSWDECRDAVKRAMRGDNLRPRSIEDSIARLDVFRRMFPEAKTPADITADHAKEFKKRRMECGLSAWTVKGDIATMKSIFGKWLLTACGLIKSNPFADIKPPKCDEPDVRIVSAKESAELFAWFNERWNNWRLPIVYLQVASLVGWRATEIASLRTADLLDGGYLQVAAKSSKTRGFKYGWLPKELTAELAECANDGFAFGRFTEQLKRRLYVVRHCAHHATRVKAFSPKRLVGWLQDELQRFNDTQAKALPSWEPFTLHDFRKTAITGMQMAGVSEKEASIMVGATPEVIRKHYEKLDGMTIAKRNIERLVAAGIQQQNTPALAHRLRTGG